MLLMILFMMISSLISLIVMKISMILSKKMKMNMEKMSPFECGFDPLNMTRLPFSLKFFLITIIFLIFDVEIALLLPLVYTFYYSNLIYWTITSMMILLILIMGLFNEWNQGALNWI